MGKINRDNGKELVKHRAKGRGSPTSAYASEKPADATNNDDIKNQMQVLMGLVPIISEMKSAYDSYLEDSREESEGEGNNGIVIDDVAGPLGDGENLPDAVTHDSMLYFDKVAGTSAQSEINVNENISKGVSKILTEGSSRETLEEISKKYAMPTYCPQFDVVQCNAEVYKNASPRARTKDCATNDSEISSEGHNSNYILIRCHKMKSDKE
ncbi:hypothetical protein PoB_005389600 [Plakobranchus ocellatus]|uniref:Uncharacterized protein n=1 Tax=Plakobranchus ocellatus TaxID=259542 RepID=A0AAV4C7S2_9GAST|nr:hypothetical protein PoB_005389600 [Plakobranchus ocellatus]